MKGYLSYFKVVMLTGIQYKIAALAGVFTQFFWGFLQIFIYEAFYAGQAGNEPISYAGLVTYVWLQQALYALLYIRYRDPEFMQSIKDGSVAYELLRPYNMYVWWYVKCIAKKLASVSLRFFPIILIAIFLPEPYNLQGPESLASFVLFLTTLTLGTFVLTGIVMLVQMIGFITYDDRGITIIITTIAELLSGLVLPIPLLPQIIQTVTYFLPFRLVGDLSFRIYSGNIPIAEALQNIWFQIFWIIALILIGSAIMKKATKKIYIQGG